MACINPPSNKWRKGLSLFSKKPLSPTALAAANEKFVRSHGHTQPRPATVHSEDLTASQFARMTGIKIKKIGKYADRPYLVADESSDDDDEDWDEHDPNTATLQSYSSSKSCPRIWDSDFWQTGHKRVSLMHCCSQTSSHTAASASSAFSVPSTSTDATTSHTSLTQRAYSDPSASQPRPPSVIHKGRFKIVLGQDQDSDPATPVSAEPHVVEWKRKRALTT